MYFAHLDRTNSPANALQKQAAELLRDRSNRLVPNKDIFLKELVEDIDELNAKHPRCSRLVVSKYGTTEDSIGIVLGSHFTIGFYLYKVKPVGTKCSKCNRLMPSDANFCGDCGSSFNSKEATNAN